MRRFIRSVFVFFIILQFSFLFPIATSFSAENPLNIPTYTPSKLRLSALGSTDERGIFYIDYLLPLYYSQDQSTLLFFNPKESLSSPSSEETNLGIGIRKIFNDSFILGTHLFFDRKRAHSNNVYSQVGAGLEFLSQPLDFRLNYYNPITDAKAVDDTYEFGSTTLININSMEEPLGGFDFEFGFPVLPEKFNSRLYLGGFFFSSELGEDVTGYKIRSETNLTNWLALDMTLNGPNSKDAEFIAGLRVTIPLELGRVLARKNPFKPMPKDAPIQDVNLQDANLQNAYLQERDRLMEETMNQAKRSSYLKDRLFERVVRDIDVQLQNVTTEENVPGIEMIYVDNTQPHGGDGSLENPYDTLEEAFTSERYVGEGGNADHIYVFEGDGTNNGYTSDVGYELDDQVVLWGSNYNGGYKGLPVTGGYPMIDGDDNADAVITLADNNTVQGLDIEHGNDGIYGENITGASILHNRIANNTGAGIDVEFYDGQLHSGFTFDGNTITGNGGGTNTGIYIYNYNGSALADFTFSGNTISGNDGPGVHVYNNDGTISNFTFTTNTITGNEDSGIYIDNDGSNGAIEDFTFTGNTITGNGGGYSGAGIMVNNATNDGTVSDFTFYGNTIIGGSGFISGGILLNNASSGGMDGFTFYGNTITGGSGMYGSVGILMSNTSDDGTVSDFAFLNNTITVGGGMVGSAGIAAANASSGGMNGFTFDGNIITGGGGGGGYGYGGILGGGIVVGNMSDGAVDDFKITNNTITGASGNGIGMYSADTAGTLSNFSLDNNTIIGNGNGISVDNAGSNSFIDDFSFTNNTITGNGDNGVLVDNSGSEGAIEDFIFTGNVIAGNGSNGVYVVNNDSSGSISYINLGDGVSGGYNSIYNNGDFDMQNDSGAELQAQYNFWGQATPDAGQFGGGDDIDYTHPLSSDPN